jgi:hypothetical protein
MVIPPVAAPVAAAKVKATRVVWGVGQNKVKLNAAVNEWNTNLVKILTEKMGEPGHFVLAVAPVAGTTVEMGVGE